MDHKDNIYEVTYDKGINIINYKIINPIDIKPKTNKQLNKSGYDYIRSKLNSTAAYIKPCKVKDSIIKLIIADLEEFIINDKLETTLKKL